jgi:hypothetical protein
MRTKSSIRIMMTITMKLVPLMRSLRLSIRLPRSAVILPFLTGWSARTSRRLELVLVEHPSRRRERVLLD